MLRHKKDNLTNLKGKYMQHKPKIIKHSVGTFIECNDKFLTLYRTDKTWGLASGGIEVNETPIQAAIREIFEETGLQVNSKDLEFVSTIKIELVDINVIYSTFKLIVHEPFSVILDPNEHTDYKWVTQHECREMNLIVGFHQILDEVYGPKKILL